MNEQEPTIAELFRMYLSRQQEIDSMRNDIRDLKEFKDQITGGRRVALWLFATLGVLASSAAALYTVIGSR